MGNVSSTAASSSGANRARRISRQRRSGCGGLRQRGVRLHQAGRDVHIHGAILARESDIDAGGKVTMRFMEGGTVSADEEE